MRHRGNVSGRTSEGTDGRTDGRGGRAARKHNAFADIVGGRRHKIGVKILLPPSCVTKSRDWICRHAGVRAGASFQPAAIPVWTWARRAGAGAATHRDAGENLVPESTLQDEAEAGVGRRTAAAASSVGGGGDGERVSSSRRPRAAGERRRRPLSVRTSKAGEPVESTRRRRRRRRLTALATRLPAGCRPGRQFQLRILARVVSSEFSSSVGICGDHQ